ncbi:MAG: DegT/DnrJ/EryC1/StrS family aminotransferase [Flavobacteriaceae bacterium]
MDERVNARRKIMRFIKTYFFRFCWANRFSEPSQGYFSNHWLTCILIDPDKASFSSEDLRKAFEQENIESRPLWKPMHLQPVFKDAPFYGAHRVSEKLFSQGLCLPSGSNLSAEDLQRINIVIQQFA